ncbi:MAG: DUF4148 domain-containing protein [Janthinobacterium lividum]
MFVKKIVLMLAVVATSGSVFAQSVYPSANQSDAMISQSTQPFVSDKTRAQVRQELQVAVADGSMSMSDRNAEDSVRPHHPALTRTRQEVRAEAVQARNNPRTPNAALYSGN